MNHTSFNYQKAVINSVCIILCLIASLASNAQGASPSPCELSRQHPIAFTSTNPTDTLQVRIHGDSCNTAEVSIIILDEQQQSVYNYTDQLVNLLPYPIYDPELRPLLNSFAEKLLSEAVNRTTRLLPSYTDTYNYYEATNDFVVIPTQEYEALRQQDVPIIWHVTGNASWVHLVYDNNQHASRVIMRGGVFSEP